MVNVVMLMVIMFKEHIIMAPVKSVHHGVVPIKTKLVMIVQQLMSAKIKLAKYLFTQLTSYVNFWFE